MPTHDIIDNRKEKLVDHINRIRQHRKKTQLDERSRLESADGEFRIARRGDFVKVRDAPVQLGADAADEKVA